MERENAEKTSSVHFLRFDLMPEMIAALKEGAALGVGIEQENYNVHVNAVPESVRTSLAADFD